MILGGEAGVFQNQGLLVESPEGGLWNAAYSTQWNLGPVSEVTVEKYGTKTGHRGITTDPFRVRIIA